MRYWNLARQFKNWHAYLTAKFGINDSDPLQMVTRSGVQVEVPRRLLHTFKEVFMAEDYALVQPLGSPEPVILDIGANAGYFTLYAASCHPGARIFSFEPVPVNFNLLKRNQELNSGRCIQVFQQAVAGRDGSVRLTLDPEDSFTTSARLSDQGPDQGGELEVVSRSLESIFEEQKIEICDFLKMDCEGAEYDILYSTSSKLLGRVQQMILEVHPGPGPKENMEVLEGYLKGCGFNTCRRPVDMLCAWRES